MHNSAKMMLNRIWVPHWLSVVQLFHQLKTFGALKIKADPGLLSSQNPLRMEGHSSPKSLAAALLSTQTFTDCC